MIEILLTQEAVSDPIGKVDLFFEVINRILDGLQAVFAHPFVHGFLVGSGAGGLLGFKKVREGAKKLNPMRPRKYEKTDA